MGFGAYGFKLLVAFDGPFGAAANFELFEQLQFSLGLEQVGALLGDLAMKLLAARLERGGSALKMGFEVGESDVILPGGGRGVADVSAGLVELSG